MARSLQMRLSVIPIFFKNLNIFHLQTIHNLSPFTNHHIYSPSTESQLHVLRWYARERKHVPFGRKLPEDAREFRKVLAKTMDNEEDCLWTGSDDDNDDDDADDETKYKNIKKERNKAKQRARGDKIDADDSDELWGVWSGSDEEKTLWTGDEMDTDDDTPPKPYPNEKRDESMNRLFEFDERPKMYNVGPKVNFKNLRFEDDEEEPSPGTLVRKLAVENALKKLKKGPDGRYINVWEVMSDVDILIGAFETIISGPEYEELRMGGPKKLDMQFFKDIQAQMRDPTYQYSPELKLKPKSKILSRKRYEKVQAKRRKARRGG